MIPSSAVYLVAALIGAWGTENQKNHCGERHYIGALGVDYRVITSADDLPQG